jgi:signal transduction histidine kinase
MPRIFGLFVQSARSLDRSEGGLGIGLSVVERLMEMHGGTVAASSAGPGKGSTFELHLPRIDATPGSSTRLS